jgi:hypothetical protein
MRGRPNSKEPEQTPEQEENALLQSFARKQKKANRFDTQNGWIIP